MNRQRSSSDAFRRGIGTLVSLPDGLVRALVSPLSLALLALLMLACGARQTPPPSDALDDPVAVFEATLDRFEAMSSLRMRATLEYFGEDGRVRVDQVVLARRPGDVRMETISPFGTTLSVFTMNTDALVLYDLQASDYVTGTPSTTNIARLIPFPLSAADLVRVLFGAPPLDAVDPDPHQYTMAWDARRGGYRLHMPLADDAGSLEVWIAHGSWTMTAARMTRDGDVVFDLRSGRPMTVTGTEITTEMPRRIEFEMPMESIDVTLDTESVVLDPPLVDALFTVPVPRGVTPRAL